MRKVLSLLLAAAIAAFAVSCSGEKFEAGAIEMEFQLETLDIDLNLSDNPYVLCVINSETALASVTMFIVRKDGTEEQYKDPVTSFRKSTMYTVHERPVYDETMVGLKIVAKDKGGAVKSGTVNFDIIPVVTPPVTSFRSEELSFAEGDPIPEFSFTVAAKAALVRVTVQLIESGEIFELVPDIVSFGDGLSFTFNSSDYDIPEYNLDKIPQAIRVLAEDSYGKIGIALLNIGYKALPRPELTVADLPSVDEFTGFTVSGGATSETGIDDISVYAVADGYEAKVGGITFTGEQECTFSINIDGSEIMEYLSGIKVVATDLRTKKTEVTVPLSVRPVFWEVSQDDDLLSILQSQLSDARFRKIKLSLAPDASYNLGSESVGINKSLIIKSPEGHQATLTSSAAQAFITTSAQVDTIRFSNLHFTTKKSGAGMFSFKSASTIGRVLVEGCLVDGSWSLPFFRFQDGSNSAGSLEIDDCIIKWANTNGGYSFLHFATNSDKVANLSLTRSTVSGPLYLCYCNINTGTIAINISNNTFVNLKGSANGVIIAIAQSALKGAITLKDNLYGGTTNITGTYRQLRANKLTASYENNWCTSDWKTFEGDGVNGTVDFISVLPEAENTAAVFEDLENFDLTVKAGTSVRTNKVGDPRWLK